jgi:putative FmdB family regulatory protein
MPIYAYRCDACGHAKDVLQKMSDPQLTECPSCGKAEFKKQLTAAGFQLKGTGWYVTDFRKGGAKKGATTVDANASDAKSEAKPDAKSDIATPAASSSTDTSATVSTASATPATASPSQAAAKPAATSTT